MTLVGKVRRTLVEREMLRGRRHLLVGCSGGPDSTALLQVLAELAPAFSLRLTAASVDHGLRPGVGSELAGVASHAESLAVEHRILRVSVDRERGKQAGARRARYHALHQLARELGATGIAVGHTLDDQAETLVARFLRAPSVAGLAGIEPVRRDGVIRPLIACSREHVLRFLASRALTYAIDPSNSDEAYTRARIRHRLLPSLLEENPRLVASLCELAEDARLHRELVEASAPELDLTQAGAWSVLREQPAAVQRYLLRTWLQRHLEIEVRLSQVRALARGVAGEPVLLRAGRTATWMADGALQLGEQTKRTRGS